MAGAADLGNCRSSPLKPFTVVRLGSIQAASRPRAWSSGLINWAESACLVGVAADHLGATETSQPGTWALQGQAAEPRAQWLSPI